MSKPQPPLQAFSVSELVRRRAGDSPDTWNLALVQRAEVWDHVRMRYLLDSLLAGYPIGTILVCRLAGQSHGIAPGKDRTVINLPEGSWQLLDGQQRINALFAMFTAKSAYGRFYLDLLSAREVPGPVTGRRARDRGLGYIIWQDRDQAATPIIDRDRYIDLGRWYTWAEDDHGARIEAAAEALRSGPDSVVRIAQEIDPDFTDHVDERGCACARERLQRLMSLWREPVVPVQFLSLASPLEVLEVFTRINRAGVQVAGPDLFFAAVKTLWSEGEETVARMADQLRPSLGSEGDRDPLIERIGVLRLLGRLASRAMRQADLVPLVIDRLTGDRGLGVISAMRDLSDAATSPMISRTARLSNLLARESALGFGLYSIDDRLWDDVLGWAAVNPNSDNEEWLADNLGPIDSYLLGATAFRYAAIFGDRFARLALTEALHAGLRGEPFPLHKIVEVTRGTVGTALEGNRQAVRSASSADDVLWLADMNAALFLSVVQQIPYAPQRNAFDWDHIYPQGKAGLMWSAGPGGKYRRHHRYRRYIASAGNRWGLNASLNRELQATMPRLKFALIEKYLLNGDLRVWPRDRWWLQQDEIVAFGSIGDDLESVHKVDAAMDRFHRLVMARARRLVNLVFTSFPDARFFALDAKVDSASADPEPPDIATALGLHVPEPSVEHERTREPSSREERIERILLTADAYGVGLPLRHFLERVTDLGLQVRGYKRTLTVTPPRTLAVSLIALAPNEGQRGSVETWVAPKYFAQHFPTVPAVRFDEMLGGIRGQLLSGVQIEALGDSLEEVLAPAAMEGLCRLGDGT